MNNLAFYRYVEKNAPKNIEDTGVWGAVERKTELTSNMKRFCGELIKAIIAHPPS